MHSLGLDWGSHVFRGREQDLRTYTTEGQTPSRVNRCKAWVHRLCSHWAVYNLKNTRMPKKDCNLEGQF